MLTGSLFHADSYCVPGLASWCREYNTRNSAHSCCGQGAGVTEQGEPLPQRAQGVCGAYLSSLGLGTPGHGVGLWQCWGPCCGWLPFSVHAVPLQEAVLSILSIYQIFERNTCRGYIIFIQDKGGN